MYVKASVHETHISLSNPVTSVLDIRKKAVHQKQEKPQSKPKPLCAVSLRAERYLFRRSSSLSHISLWGRLKIMELSTRKFASAVCSSEIISGAIFVQFK